MVAEFIEPSQAKRGDVASSPRNAAVDVALGIALVLLAWVVLMPNLGRHYHYQGARFHGYLKTLYVRSALWNLENNAPWAFRTNDEPYTHHPQLLIVFLQIAALVDSDLSHAEIVPRVFAVASCGVLFVAVRMLWSRRVAFFAVLACLLSPVFVLFGNFVNFEPPCLFFILLGWALYIAWWHTGQPWLFAATAVALFAGCMTDWPAYFLTGVLAAHALVAKGREGLGASIMVASVGVFSFAIFLLFCVYAQTNSFSGGLLWESLLNRLGLSPVVAPMSGPLDPSWEIHYTVFEWLERIGYHVVKLVGAALTLGALIWIGSYLLRRRRRHDWGPEGWIFLILAPAVLNNVLFNGLVWQHPFCQYYFLPGFALASALVLDRIGRSLPSKRVAVGVMVIFFLALVGQTAYIVGHYLP